MNKLAFRIAAILIVAGGAAAVAEIYGQRWVTENASALVQQVAPSARYETATYSFWRRRLVLENVALEISPSSSTLRMRRVQFSGVIPFAVKLGVSSVESEGVELGSSDGWLVYIDHLRLEAPSIPSPVSSNDWLGTMSARRLEAHAIRATRASSSETVASETVVVDDLVAGSLGRVRATNITGTFMAGSPSAIFASGKIHLQLADSQLDRVQLDVLRKAIAVIGDRSTAAAGAQTPVICEAVVINGVKLDIDGASMTTARESALRPRLRPYGWPKGAGTGAYLHQVLPLLAPVVQVDHLEASDIAMAMKGAAAFEGSVKHVSFDETGDAATMQVDQFTSSGADGSYMRSAALSVRLGLTPDGLKTQIEFDRVAWGWEETGKTALAHFAADITTTAERPFELSLALKALQLPTTLAGRLGYAALVFDGQWVGSYDDRRGVFRNRVVATGSEAGTLNLSASLGYASPDASKLASAKTVSEIMGYALARIAGLTISRAEMRYEDASFANRLLAFYATKAGQDKETFRDGLIASIKSREPDQAAPSPELERATANLERVAAFLKNPQTLVMTVEPPRPVSWLNLLALGSLSPEQQVNFFGLTVK